MVLNSFTIHNIKGANMINGNPYQALTNNGIQELFNQNFEGQRYTLQIIYYSPSKDDAFMVFLSDGFAWIKGQFIGEAKYSALRNQQLKNFSVVTFLSDDIEVNAEKAIFRLKRILETNNRVHNKIGQPIKYEDYKTRGCVNDIGSNNINSGVIQLPIKKVKQLPIGKVKGTIIAKVVRKPDKIGSFLNIIIEDEHKQQIQCCFFGSNVQKYHPLLHVGGWYRFQDPMLQANNRQGGNLQLKITEYSNVVKLKIQTESKQVGFFKTNVAPQIHRFKPQSEPQTQFKLPDFEGKSDVNEQLNYFVTVRVVKINTMRDGLSRSLVCKDKTGSVIQITIWKEFESVQILVDESYKFRFLKVKIYKGTVSLQSRRLMTKVEISLEKIQRSSEVTNANNFIACVTKQNRYKQKVLDQNIKNLKQMTTRMQNSSQRVCYGVVFGTLIYSFQHFVSSTDLIAEMRRKLFYLNCPYCDKNQYRKGKIQPELLGQKIICGLCKSPEITLFWNLKVSLADSEMQLSCQLNNQIAQKLLNMTSYQAMAEFLKNPEKVRKVVYNKLNLHSGVFKISSKINERRVGDRFYNIIEYYPDGQKAKIKRVVEQFQQALEAHSKYCFKATESAGRKQRLDTSINEKKQKITIQKHLQQDNPQNDK